ncbi:MAG TPA: LysR substrate-binding domain-containing protein [Rhodocyclaceae bacterium]|nr:LysR substrate-binding domain-containing protein [Rhodocyclaceae bacterium]
MNLSDLHIFRTVMREGGITKAASVLNRVQSNVTTRVRQLEDDLGVPLFVRENKRLLPTPAAHLLLDYSEKLIQLADQARAAVTSSEPAGLLRLGSMESTAAARLPKKLAAFHAQFPKVQLELRTGATGRLVADVLAGKLECALVGGPLNDDRLDATEVFREELVLVAPAGHPPIKRPSDVEPRTLLAFEASCAYRQRLEQWLASGKVVPERIVELSSYHAMMGCVAAGMGIALAPVSLLNPLGEKRSLSIHHLPAKYADAPTLFVTRRDHRSPAAQALLQNLLK